MQHYTKPLDIRYDAKPQSFKISEPSHKVPMSCMFLCRFDVRKGNELVWSQTSPSSPNIALKNLEFKTIPSGIHETQKDLVHFVIPKLKSFDDVYYGVSCFEQNALALSENSDQLDRSKVLMYSLGVIVDANFRYKGVSKSKYYDWKPNQFISATEYISDIQDLLSHWLQKVALSPEKPQDYELFETYFESNCLKPETATLSSPVLRRSWQNSATFTGSPRALQDKHPHMIESLMQWFSFLGPLIFPLWKASLLRQRVLIIVGDGVSFEKCNALVYCLSILSLFPHGTANLTHEQPLQPLYTIGITDVEALTQHISEAIASQNESYEIPGFVACTGDTILEDRPELYDICLRINNEDLIPQIKTNDGSSYKATPHELELYEKLVPVHLGYELSHDEKEKICKLVEPTTWSQYLIDGFYWWATAGYMKPSYHEADEDLMTDSERDNIEIVLSLVGYFHERISTLHHSMKDAVQSSEEGNVTVSPVFLSANSLDCFSQRDYDFIHFICRRWFNRTLQVQSIDCKLLC
ncbi:LAME_0G14400g1_1 [Lachancea meyersii CBS 8951]|uniref:LAME_0G14400g1_1 n=1 Tax=Lachancea meyersii CBS 8951 TaxID=1266667 RepID=A0A1G4KAC3_9SACH|nr:LAME_0G14400g1_1 [Lachancea meyersii CBS 8951]